MTIGERSRSGAERQSWAIVERVSGMPGDQTEIEEDPSAEALAGFLRALYSRDARSSQGCPKAERVLRKATWEFGDDLIAEIGEDRARGLGLILRDAQQVPEWDGAPVWTHNGAPRAGVGGLLRRLRGDHGRFVVSMAVNGLRGLPGGKPGRLAAGRKALDRILEAC